MASEKETIVAVATPQGKAALAVIRISGKEAHVISSRCILEKERFESAEKRKVHLFTAINPENGNAIDEITAIKYDAPRSFTGENMVEIICHGGPRIVTEMAQALLAAGARTAERGEFTRRAFVNEKIDLLKAEAIQGVIESTTESDIACARKLYNRTGVVALEEWRNKLLEILAKIETNIEFEEEFEEQKIENSNEDCVKIAETIEKEINKWNSIKNFDNLLKVVIAGPANAGKSTLFNLLVGFNRAIVHIQPGTTRDIISERIWIKEHEVLLLDSAGFRNTGGEIEKMGMAKSKEEIGNAAVIVWVTSADEPFLMQEKEILNTISKSNEKCIGIISKNDLASEKIKKEGLIEKKIQSISINLLNGDKIQEVIESIIERISRYKKKIEIPDIFLNQRHAAIGAILLEEIQYAVREWKREEIAAYHLRRAISCLEEIFGKTDNEEIFKKIFDSFCIGK